MGLGTSRKAGDSIGIPEHPEESALLVTISRELCSWLGTEEGTKVK